MNAQPPLGLSSVQMTRKIERALPFVLIGLGVVALISVLGVAWWTAAITQPGGASIPTSVAGMALSTTIEGKQAVTEINRLHDNRFPLSSGAVAKYGGQGEAILWVAGAPLPFFAGRMVDVMQARIAEGNSPFRPQAVRNIGGREVFELEGMGQKHFYFRARSMVIWLAVNKDISEETLKDILDFYP
ncbi:MAG: hypothetical protein J5I90_22120 [Caldilineales bacterium]|nr:hypothetical protein [Caldilineales bacterium]